MKILLVSILFLLFCSDVVSITYISLPHDRRHFVVIAIPDTQFYAESHPDTFAEQTYYACQTALALGTIYVSHLGDLVHNSIGYPAQWIIAKNAIDTLASCGMAYSVLPGNHDIYVEDTPQFSDNETDSGTSHYKNYDKFFTAHDMKADGSYPPDTGRNTYKLVNIKNGDGWERKLLFLQLEYFPDCVYLPELLAWADQVLTANSDRDVIISAHFAGSACGDYIAGQIQYLFYRHCNILLALGGHVIECGGERAIPYPRRCGGSQWVLVSNYQVRENGGDGWLRIYNFSYAATPNPDATENVFVSGYTFSPLLGQYEDDPTSHFCLNYTYGSWGTQSANASLSCPLPPVYVSSYVNPGYLIIATSIATICISALLYCFANVG